MLLNWKKKLFLDDDCQKYANIIYTGETTLSSAEGATTPETLRQKDRTY